MDMDREDGDLVICRCEEVTRADILDAVQEGAHTLWQIRRLTRAGMGLCQGRSCETLMARIMAEALGVPIDQVLRPSYRPPIQPIPIDTLASGTRVDLQ
jgi:NAD(P)H-nitrite reductase large subunit